MWLFSRKDRRQLGVDVGTSAVKIVELEHSSNRLTLTNYAVLDGFEAISPRLADKIGFYFYFYFFSW